MTNCLWAIIYSRLYSENRKIKIQSVHSLCGISQIFIQIIHQLKWSASNRFLLLSSRFANELGQYLPLNRLQCHVPHCDNLLEQTTANSASIHLSCYVCQVIGHSFIGHSAHKLWHTTQIWNPHICHVSVELDWITIWQLSRLSRV